MLKVRGIVDTVRAPLCAAQLHVALAPTTSGLPSAKLVQISTEGSAGEPDREPVSRCQRAVLIGLKSDFLSKHHVARN